VTPLKPFEMKRKNDMTKVAINGFGRIGRNVLRGYCQVVGISL